jgi:hypothetical protein
MLPGFEADNGDSDYVLSIILPGFRQVRKTSESDYWRRHVCPSVRPSALKKTWLPLNGFSKNFVFDYLSKICRENPISIKI